MPKKSVILAPNVQLPFDDPKVPYPALTSCKLDGNRFVLIDGEWLSRSLKPQGNKGSNPFPSFKLKETVYAQEICHSCAKRTTSL